MIMKDNSKKSSGISSQKKILFSLFTFFILWLIIDISLYAFLKRVQKNHNLFYGFVIPNNKQIEGYAKKYFHPQWGWDIIEEEKGQFGNRKSRNYINKEEYKIKTFGDSFTYGDGVEDYETWEYFVEEETGWECLNFGVGGYGTDQALLKYKDTKIKTKYTILAILDENIGRIMTQWWGFYHKQNIQIKPKFSISDSNSIFLISNPIKYVNDVKKLRDVEFVNKLKKDDYWYSYYTKLNGPKKLIWPATFTVIPHIGFFINNFKVYIKNFLTPSFESETATSKFFHLYNKNSDGIRIMQYIVDEFINTANKRGEIPIILIFPNNHSVDILKKFGKKPYQSLVKYLEDIQSDFIDFGDVFVQEKYINYYKGQGGHFSADGNKRIANALVNYIKQLEQ